MLIQFILGDNAVRGRIVRLNQNYQDALSNHDYPQKVAEISGQTIALGAMMSSNLKENGIFTLQMQGNETSAVRLIVAEFTNHGDFRVVARLDHEKVNMQGEDASLETLFGLNAIVAFTMDFDLKDRYQSVAALDAPRLDQAIQKWQDASNQIGSYVRLEACWNANDPTNSAFGLMLEPIAHQELSEEKQQSLKQQWDDAKIFAKSLTKKEIFEDNLSLEDILYRLFHELDIRILQTQELTFACRCSEEKIITTLQNLEQQSDEDLMEGKDHIDVTCEYCGKNYHILKAQLKSKPVN